MKTLKPIEPKKKQRAIIQGVLTQIEMDMFDGDYEAFDELMCCLLSNKANEKALWNYLGDNVQEKIMEGKLDFRY